MRNKILKISAIVIALALVIGFAEVLMMYRETMKGVSLDLSLVPQMDGMDIDPSKFDNKGWSVYIQEGETKTELTPNGFGGYTGLELGQTIYLSRPLTEELDSPTLQLGTIERQFSIWLDDDLIYTDCPELDNRIGYLNFPMNPELREDPITVSLPRGYIGKTLTIAQSTPPWSETGSVMAWPADIQLYSGYAYESELISETVEMMLIAALAFIIGVALLVLFIRNRDWSVLCLSIVAFVWMTNTLVGVSFFHQYFGSNGNDITSILPLVSAAALLVFLTLRGGRHSEFLWIGSGLYLASVVVFGIIVGTTTEIIDGSLWHFLIDGLPHWLAFVTLAALLVMGVVFWRKESWFYKVFTPLALGGIVLSWLVVILFINRGQVWTQLQSSFKAGQIGYIYQHSYPAVAGSS